MNSIDITESTYENLIHIKNASYNRINVLHDVDTAKTCLETYLLGLSDEQLKQHLRELLSEQNYTFVYESEEFFFVENRMNIYCFLFGECSLEQINLVAKAKCRGHYTMVYSVYDFIKTQMHKSLFSLLLRDYDTLNFVPEEYQKLQEALSVKWA